MDIRAGMAHVSKQWKQTAIWERERRMNPGSYIANNWDLPAILEWWQGDLTRKSIQGQGCRIKHDWKSRYLDQIQCIPEVAYLVF